MSARWLALILKKNIYEYENKQIIEILLVILLGFLIIASWLTRAVKTHAHILYAFFHVMLFS